MTSTSKNDVVSYFNLKTKIENFMYTFFIKYITDLWKFGLDVGRGDVPKKENVPS